MKRTVVSHFLRSLWLCWKFTWWSKFLLNILELSSFAVIVLHRLYCRDVLFITACFDHFFTFVIFPSSQIAMIGGQLVVACVTTSPLLFYHRPLPISDCTTLMQWWSVQLSQKSDIMQKEWKWSTRVAVTDSDRYDDAVIILYLDAKQSNQYEYGYYPRTTHFCLTGIRQSSWQDLG